jgi:pyruvate/2-oxoglutarate/acetoin dehydrogenase E1 component
VSITYLEAIREAQAKMLRDDDRVFIYGQDVGGAFGGAFKATKGLAKEFPERVLNTPISEDAIVGAAIGAAMQGMRPIVEMQFADFSSVANRHAGAHYCAFTFRWNKGKRSVSQSIDGIALRALSRSHRDDTGHGRRRLHDVDRSRGNR